LRQVSNVASSQKRIQKYVAGGSAAELRRQFDVNLRDRSDRPDSYQVTLIPKQKQVRETLTRLDLWVQRTSFLLSAIQMTFASGDTRCGVRERGAQCGLDQASSASVAEFSVYGA